MHDTDSPNDRILIMGIGNLLMRDEGVGIHLVNRLAETSLPPHVDILDGGTGGFHLLEYFENYSNVILIDATLDRRPPGTIRLIKPRFADDFPAAMSTHDIGMKDLVGALHLLDCAPAIHLLVVSIGSIQEQGIGLGKEIEDIMPVLVDKVRELVRTITQHLLSGAMP